MTTIIEGNLSCTFPTGWDVTHYDAWSFFRNRFKDCCCGNKAVDIVAIDKSNSELWLIELKDYRQFKRTKEIHLWEEVAIKVRDTLAGLFAASVDASHPDQKFAQKTLTAARIRIVVHLEQPKRHCRLFHRDYDLSKVQQKLKALVKPINAQPKVVELDNMGSTPWTAASVGHS